jgi:hypothetical protein
MSRGNSSLAKYALIESVTTRVKEDSFATRSTHATSDPPLAQASTINCATRVVSSRSQCRGATIITRHSKRSIGSPRDISPPKIVPHCHGIRRLTRNRWT